VHLKTFFIPVMTAIMGGNHGRQSWAVLTAGYRLPQASTSPDRKGIYDKDDKER
jgi:hypothetical protein